MTDPIRVLAVDDHLMFVDLVRLLLEREADIEFVGAAGTAEDALEMCRRRCPQVVLLDVDLPGMDGIEATRRIRSICPEAQVVIVTAFQERPVVVRAIEAGACGYVPKTHAADELPQVVRRAAAGEIIAPAGGTRTVVERLLASRESKSRERGRTTELTSREIQVLQAVAEGKSTAEVAQALYLSPFTVQGHIKRILSKLGVRTKLEAVTLALREGIIRLPEPQ